MKINMLKGIMLGAVACIIIGCGESEKSVEYYLNHDKEREEKVKGVYINVLTVKGKNLQ